MVASAITLASCNSGAKKDGAAVLSAGFDMANIDSTAKPTDDFYQFVNGKWLKNTVIPQEESRWGSFNELAKKNQEKLRIILDSAAMNKSAVAGSNQQKIGDFYALAMDSVKLNKDAASPLNEEFTAIDKIKEGTVAQIAVLHKNFISQLSNKLTPTQVDQVKNGMTYNVLNVTYNGYNQMIRTLTDPQKKQIMAWLTEAREQAMDAESSEKKHGVFGKYKGRMYNYLSAAGYNLKKEGDDWEKRIKEEAASKKKAQ